MAELNQKRIFANNLKHYLDINMKSQKEVADAINVSPQTFNTWCQAVAIPRMDKIQKLADYFRINKSDLLDEHTPNNYYFDEETFRIAQSIFNNHDLKMLFDTAQYASPAVLKATVNLLKTVMEDN